MALQVIARGGKVAKSVVLVQLAIFMLVTTALNAQETDYPRKANWELQEKYSSTFLRQYIYGTSVSANWIGEEDLFWYSYKKQDGMHYYLVDCDAQTKEPLFDRAKMAAELSKVGQRPQEANSLNLGSLAVGDDLTTMTFTVNEVNFEYDFAAETLKKVERRRGRGGERGARAQRGRGNQQQRQRNRGNQQRQRGQGRGGEQDEEEESYKTYSPDKEVYVFGKNYNLYYAEEGYEDEALQLTTDGEKDFGYGSGGDEPSRVRVTWSKNSELFYVQKSDRRGPPLQLYLVNSITFPRPTLRTYSYSFPGDPVALSEYYAFNRENEELVKIKTEKFRDQNISGFAWDEDQEMLRFTRRDRPYNHYELCEADPYDGDVTVLLEEVILNSWIETKGQRKINDGKEIIWWSERDGWGHFYLYDSDWNLKNQITAGPFKASAIVKIDEDERVMYFTGNAREQGENIYNAHLYRVYLDGSDLTLLNPGKGNHRASLSPSNNYVVSSMSQVDVPHQAFLYDADGNKLMDLEEMDLSRILATGWKPPKQIVVKSADGVTDIISNMWVPFDLDPNKKYPIINYVYPGPQMEAVSSSFSPTAGHQGLAQLGFIVVEIGNRGGTPGRSKLYHNYGWGNFRDYGLADKKAGIEQLAAKYPFIDIDRTGIYGHSGGGFMTGAAMLVPPFNEFFKVGVSSAGNHDNNVYNRSWGRQSGAIQEVTKTIKDEDGNDKEVTVFESTIPANHEMAKNLKGNLLLAHGDMDTNVHPAGTIRLINELIKAGKRFDFMIFPGSAHGLPGKYWGAMRTRYFVEHLLGDYTTGAEMYDYDY